MEIPSIPQQESEPIVRKMRSDYEDDWHGMGGSKDPVIKARFEVIVDEFKNHVTCYVEKSSRMHQMSKLIKDFESVSYHAITFGYGGLEINEAFRWHANEITSSGQVIEP